MTKPSILLTGSRGQLGLTLAHYWSASDLAKKFELLHYDIDEMDLTSTSAVNQELNRVMPHTIVNTAAYTAVDQAEAERDAAFAVNEHAVANLADWAAAHDCRIVHVSTDFVFDGRQDSPYGPEDIAAPLSIYGASKLAGEQQLAARLPDNHVIVRTSWLYSEYGKNFVKTMLRLMQQQEELGVVADQIGSPTSTHTLAAFLLSLLNHKSKPGIYHWTDGASISWYEFAVAIQREYVNQGMLNRKVMINPITTAEYPTAATRPAYSVLDRNKALVEFQLEESSWQEELGQVVTRIKQGFVKST
ncbi:MAG: dTDP-4-dehydrorhamnose reductase [Proteobacteria bacterium]|nr:dTDP-4-dehydrorhamnose reductase [Pseudomonadota bacterium]